MEEKQKAPPALKEYSIEANSDQDGISLLLQGLEAGLHGQIGSAG